MNVLKQQERDSDHQTGETKMKGHQVEGSGRINALGRALTKILRHRAAELNLEMRSDGFCKVADLLRLDFTTRSKVPLSAHTVEEVLQAVEQDSKERLATMVDESGELLIRANQGHTLLDAVCSDDLLEEISIDDNLLAVCVHGTFKHALPGILRDGLKTMGRKHVHFAAGLPGAGEVVSGMRGNCDALVFVNAARAMADGMKFYVSKNGVVLTEGFEQCVPAKYFDKIVEWPSNVLLHDREEITE
ncbi:hypothetical protein SELMODRAFT_108368 [Selaginella moellendorffii]|uniref:2'-phosphotransferase n=1 Tax=Selaginella moellendorffii TaxID=88036 RepID=D8S404_SELML|nr:hypothetical protein SELMODRAFT_108368 [Selaginella moellendorffii]